MADAEDGNGDGNSSLDCSFAHCMPLTAHAPSAEVAVPDRDARKPGRIFYGNDMFYVLFRYHPSFLLHLFATLFPLLSCLKTWLTKLLSCVQASSETV